MSKSMNTQPATKTSKMANKAYPYASRQEMSKPNHFSQAEFLISAPKLNLCPPEIGLEVAFAGRSNAGKSSALNCLTKKNLARTSKTPGRTQLINFFSLGNISKNSEQGSSENKRLVDLPGYGYAKVPEAMQREWGKHLGEYLTQRQSLRGLILVMDARHPLTDLDEQMLEAALQRDLPVHCLLTKADKLKNGPAAQQLNKVRKALAELGPKDQLSAQLFSSLKNQGLAVAWQQLNHWLEIEA